MSVILTFLVLIIFFFAMNVSHFMFRGSVIDLITVEMTEMKKPLFPSLKGTYVI